MRAKRSGAQEAHQPGHQSQAGVQTGPQQVARSQNQNRECIQVVG